MKEFEIKKKHHYVWAYYLKGWANDGTNVWYITKKGNIRSDSIRGIGCENHFYKVALLSSNDIKLIHMMLKDCASELKKTLLDLVAYLHFIQQQALLLDHAKPQKLDVNLSDVISNNFFENYMSMQEANVVDVIRKLREGDSSCLDDKQTFWSLGYFLGHQLSRTKRMRDITLWSVQNSKGNEDARKIWMEFNKKHWWFMCTYMGTSLSMDISLNPNKRVRVIENLTTIPFITSDQPVININPDGHNGESVDYYYPLSDKRALIVLTSNRFDFDDLITNESIVHFLNQEMAGDAGDTIFSSDEKIILKYRADFNKRKYKFSQ
ncbi:DUF4238 domain-containing protein [Klebsiella pneumoniae]